jgi:hypothetical protein
MAFQNILSPYGPGTSNQYAQAAAQPLSAAFGSIGNFAGAIGNMGSSYMRGLGDQGAAYSNNYGAYSGGLTNANNALAGTMGAYTQGLGELGKSGAQTFGYLGQGLQGLGNAYTGAYGGYAGALGEIGKAMSSERSGFYNANATAEAARQAALGNIGTASLGSYGQAANSALGAWAQNQQAYNQALAGLGSSNQTALAQAAASRNAALGGMGGAYADLGGRLGAASALGNISFGFGGGGGDGFSATGPGGTIASGSYGGDGGGMSGYGTRVSDTSQLASMGVPAYGGLDRLQNNLMASDITGSMNANYTDSMDRLNAQHYSSRDMPSQMLGQTLSGLLTMGRDAYGQIGGGMNQYYATQDNPANRVNYGGILGQLSSGYQDASRNIGGAQRDLMGGFGTTMAALPGYARDMRSAFNTTRGDINANTGRLAEGFGNANTNVGSVVGSLGQGFQSGVGALKDLFGEGFGKLFKTEFEIGEDRRKNEAAERMKNYTRTYGYTPKNEQLIGDMYGLPNYGPKDPGVKPRTLGPMGQWVYG